MFAKVFLLLDIVMAIRLSAISSDEIISEENTTAPVHYESDLPRVLYLATSEFCEQKFPHMFDNMMPWFLDNPFVQFSDKARTIETDLLAASKINLRKFWKDNAFKTSEGVLEKEIQIRSENQHQRQIFAHNEITRELISAIVNDKDSQTVKAYCVLLHGLNVEMKFFTKTLLESMSSEDAQQESRDKVTKYQESMEKYVKLSTNLNTAVLNQNKTAKSFTDMNFDLKDKKMTEQMKDLLDTFNDLGKNVAQSFQSGFTVYHTGNIPMELKTEVESIYIAPETKQGKGKGKGKGVLAPPVPKGKASSSMPILKGKGKGDVKEISVDLNEKKIDEKETYYSNTSNYSLVKTGALSTTVLPGSYKESVQPNLEIYVSSEALLNGNVSILVPGGTADRLKEYEIMLAPGTVLCFVEDRGIVDGKNSRLLEVSPNNDPNDCNSSTIRKVTRDFINFSGSNRDLEKFINFTDKSIQNFHLDDNSTKVPSSSESDISTDLSDQFDYYLYSRE